MNQIFKMMNPQQNLGGFMNQVNQLKAGGGDPNQIIQNLMNSGRISQAQYNSAVQRANQIMQMLGK